LGTRDIPQYVTHGIYSDAGFARLTDLLTGFVQHHRWGADGRRIMHRDWNDDRDHMFDQRSLIANSPWEKGDVGQGVLLRIVHLRKARQTRTLAPGWLSPALVRRFRSYPNRIDIDMHRRNWPFSFQVLLDIARCLKAHGARTLMATVTGDSYSVLEGGDTDSTVSHLQEPNAAALSPSDIDRHAQRMALRVSAWDNMNLGVWSRLDGQTRGYLELASFYSGLSHSAGSELLDHSAFCSSVRPLSRMWRSACSDRSPII
jgi:hypothetical protein